MQKKIRFKACYTLFALFLTVCLLVPNIPVSAADGVTKDAKTLGIEASLTAYTVPSSMTSISIGQTKSGTLSTADSRDPLYSTCYADAYYFTGTVGQQIAITEYSKAFSPYMTLYKRDSSSSTNMTYITQIGTSTGTTARLPATGYYTLPSTGTYFIIASSYLSYKTGAYTISIASNAAVNTVAGKVTKVNTTGSPLAGATVSIGGKSAVTDLDGTYTVSGLTTGTKTMTVSKTGYTSKSLSVNVTSTGVTANTYLVPKNYYTVSGKITNTAGTGVSSAAVKLDGKTVTTNSVGNYTVTNVANDTYTMTVSKAGYGSLTKVITVNSSNLTGVNLTLTAGTTMRYVGLNSTNQALSLFNGSKIYSISSVTPSTKPQGNGTPSLYSFKLTTNGPTASFIGNQASKSAISTTLTSAETVYGKGQLSVDERMRAEENKWLASGAQQYNKAAKSAATPITVGKAWNGVKIVVTNPNTTINTVCRYISQYAYFFVDTADWPTTSANGITFTKSELAAYAAAFEQIYLKDRSNFGTVRDVDNNNKVIVVFSKKLTGGLLGYFYSGDKYSQTLNSYSNQGDIFYVTTDNYTASTIKGTLAHELQHMIYFDQHYIRGVTNTYTWLNEALSQAAEYYNGYTDNHNAWMRSYLTSGWKNLSLTHWTSNNYGCGAVFMRYLIDQYGVNAVRNMCATNKVGIQAVEAATGKDFNYIFNNFTRAVVMDDTGNSTDPLYRFSSLNLRTLQPTGRGGLLPGWTFASSTDVTCSFGPYNLCFLQWSGNFGTMSQNGTGVQSTAFGLSY